MARTGKINGNVIEAFQNIVSGPPIQFGLLRIVNADISGVVGICRGYVTGAQIKGSEHVGLLALQEICRSKRGMWTIHEKCDPADFVAVNQELHLPIKDVVDEISRTGGERIFRSREAEFGITEHDDVAAEVAAVQNAMPPARPYAPQGVPSDPQTDTGRQRAVPPLGGLAVPPPPQAHGMLGKVKEIASAVSGRFRAVGAPTNETSVSAKRRVITPEEEEGLCYDPTAITKGGGILNQVLSHARNTLTRMTSLKAREQQQREAEQAQQYQAPQMQHPAPSPPAPPAAVEQLVKPQQWWPQNQSNPNISVPPEQSPQQSQQPPQPTQPPQAPQRSPEEEGSFNIAPPRDPRQSVFSNSYQFDPSSSMPPTPPRMNRTESQPQQKPDQPLKEKLSQSTILKANELFHQEVRNKTAGRKRDSSKLRAAAAAADEEDEAIELEEEEKQAGSSPWSKLFFWKKE